MGAGKRGYRAEFTLTAAKVWKFEGGNAVNAGCKLVNGDGVKDVNCVNEPLEGDAADEGEIGTGTAVT